MIPISHAAPIPLRFCFPALADNLAQTHKNSSNKTETKEQKPYHTPYKNLVKMGQRPNH